jgi:hypothetical protein
MAARLAFDTNLCGSHPPASHGTRPIASSAENQTANLVRAFWRVTRNIIAANRTMMVPHARESTIREANS